MNPDDPFEYVPVKIKALKGRSKLTDQESATGFYPHAGLLSNVPVPAARYPTTETNRNRLRARVFYLHFLGVDALELAARVTDAAAVSAKYPVPTMQASECVVCHKTLDPVAGLFQDYYDIEGVYGRRKDGWYQDMFAAGFEGEGACGPGSRWRGVAMARRADGEGPPVRGRHGRTRLLHPHRPQGPAAPQGPGRPAPCRQTPGIRPAAASGPRPSARAVRRVGLQPQKMCSRTGSFPTSTAPTAWSTALDNPARRGRSLEDVGLVHMLAPEQVERKVNAIALGNAGARLQEQLEVLYGGIDSKEVTERATDPSGAMGAIQRLMSNDVACKHTLRDFLRKPAERRLFPEIEPGVLPGSSPEADAAIRRAIAHLHELILGRVRGRRLPA